MRNGYYKVEDLIIAGLPTNNKFVQVPVMNKLGTLPYAFQGYPASRVLVKDGVAQFPVWEDYESFVAQKQGEVPAIYKQVFERADWPADATHRLGYKVGAWPCPAETEVKFFTSEEDMKNYIKDQKEWAKLEDNVFETLWVEEWDWGPVLKAC